MTCDLGRRTLGLGFGTCGLKPRTFGLTKLLLSNVASPIDCNNTTAFAMSHCRISACSIKRNGIQTLNLWFWRPFFYHYNYFIKKNLLKSPSSMLGWLICAS